MALAFAFSALLIPKQPATIAMETVRLIAVPGTAPVQVMPPAGADGLFRTDGGNLVLDCRFGPIADPATLAARLEARAGLAVHGLFIGLAADVVVAGAGGLQHLRCGGDAAEAG